MVFQGAGHIGLAVPFHYGDVDEPVQRQGPVADVELVAVHAHLTAFVLLEIVKRHAVILAYLQDPGHLYGRGGAVSHPGALQHLQVVKTVFLEIVQYARDDLGVGGRAAVGGFRHNQIGLDADPGVSVADQGGKLRPRQHFPGHLPDLRAGGDIDFSHCTLLSAVFVRLLYP